MLNIYCEEKILHEIKKLPDELIIIIYNFTNNIIKIIFYPKWNWYFANVYQDSVNFNIKFKILLNNLDPTKLRTFYKKIIKNNPEIYEYLINVSDLDIYNIYNNKTSLYLTIMDYISIQMANYIIYKKNISLNYNVSNKFISSIDNIIFLCKYILYLHSKIIYFLN